MAYELTIALKPDLSADQSKKIIGKVESTAKELGGEVKKTEGLGVKSLAYPIKKVQQANFTRFLLNIPPDKLPELRQVLGREGDLLRVMVVKGEIE